MKKLHVVCRRLFLSVGLLSWTLVATAQPSPTQSDSSHRFQGRPQLSAEQMARTMTDRMTKTLGLDKKQEKKIYKLNLKYADELLGTSENSSSNISGGRPMGGGRPGGMGGPGGRGMHSGTPGQGHPDMQRPNGNMPQPGNEEGAIRRGPRPNGMLHEVSETTLLKRYTKFQKILTDEQYSRWIRMEKERRNAEFHRRELPTPPQGPAAPQPLDAKEQ